MPKVKPIHLDGKTLEGGGQLLRLALSLSCLTGKPIHVTDIRGNRPKGRNGKGGGLKKSHTECVKFLGAACNAETSGMAEGSSELEFWPSPGSSGASRATLVPENPDGHSWTITQKTPGSIYLILQALLPFILFGPFAKQEDGNKQKPVTLTITGGTNVSASPSHEYATKVWFPTLAEHLGIPPIKATLVRRGWSSRGHTNLGEVKFEITPLAKPLAPFKIAKRGALRRFEVCALAHPPAVGQEIAETVLARLQELYPNPEDGSLIQGEITLVEDTYQMHRIQVLLVAEFEGEEGKTIRLGRDCLYDGRKRVKSEALVASVSNDLVRQISADIADGGAVDEHMQDQLVVFQALAEGESKVERKTPSLHTQTARWVAEKMLKGTAVGFEEGIGQGIGLDPFARHVV